MNEEALKTRALGLLLLCLGVGFTYWNYSMRVNEGRYYPKLALFGPVFIGIAVAAIVEAPEIPVKKMSVFGCLCLIVGSGFGFWNAFF